MTELELHNYLKVHYPKENSACEWKEFKSLSSSVSGRAGDDIISYVSAISNMEGGHLILGIEDGTHRIVGIQNFKDYTAENLPYRLVGNCTNLSSEGLIVEEFKTSDSSKTVWVIHIPKHQARLPIYTHKKKWQRIGDSLVEMTKERERAILNEPLESSYDWSGQIIPNANLQDLDATAITFARKQYAEKHRNVSEVNSWNDITFLNKAHITKQGKITNTAILLLGKSESKHFIEPAVPLITWVVRNERNEEIGYDHFHLPFILASGKLFTKIRNLKYIHLQDNTLFSTEVDMYDPFLIRESLHNCIAHQNYELARRINVVEHPSELIFTNAGSFIPQSIENVIALNSPPDKYRNPFLATAMTNLNMIEIRGGGIRKMFDVQRKRFFPMPDYDLSKSDTIKVKIPGKILDENYTKLLMQRTDLDLKKVIALDFVQKKKGDLLTEKQVKELKNEKLIEGRKPNYFVSSAIAQLINEKVKYTKNRALEKQKYKDYILQHISNHGSSTRKEIDDLLFNLLPEFMTSSQKKTKIHNLISQMSGKEIINTGTKKHPKWVLNT